MRFFINIDIVDGRLLTPNSKELTRWLSFIKAIWEGEDQLKIGNGDLLLIGYLHSDAVVFPCQSRGLVAEGYANVRGPWLDTAGREGGRGE